MPTIVITHALRTPLGSFMGSLSSLPAPLLAAPVLRELLTRSQVAPEQIEQVIMGNVLMAGQGQAPARQAALAAGLPAGVPTFTLNKVCGSGLKAVALAASDIAAGHCGLALAGGMENMSRAPYALPEARAGYRMSVPRGELLDLLVYDGLWDSFGQCHMGRYADETSQELGLSRAELDAFATASFQRAQAAQAAGAFADEIVPISIKVKKDSVLVASDEGPSKVKYDKIPTLAPAFSKDGTTTAANASTINDGAAALLLASEEKAQSLGLTPLARIVAYAEAAREPARFTLAPILAIERVLARAGLTARDIDLFEINEAFAVVTLGAMRAFDLPHEKVNVNGGAIALGHPLGASGARILVTLLHALQARGKKRGLATLCIGGGEAVAMIVERP